ncbi:MAG TPA: hypothetical protein ENH84_02320 [Phycisphaerae bacterium]|nr:hypothetical protein [Phycisphaerae bacterium]
MKTTTLLLLCILVLGCTSPDVPTTPSFSTQQPFYSPRQIDDLISSGTAVPHGAQFENQGIGCNTFLWRKSDDIHVFFFTRDGESLGEYREEILSNGRFLRIEEMYLTSTARNTDFLKAAEELPFVRKLTTLHRDGDTWMGSTIHWALLLRERDGTVTKHLKQEIERTSKASVTIIVPANVMTKDKEYYLAAYKQNITDFDKAFYRRISEEKGLQLQWGKVVNGECGMGIEWPTQHPELLFELHERIPNPPNDATPFLVRTKSILSMKRTSGYTQGETIQFESN